jgi:hypothetical protein
MQSRYQTAGVIKYPAQINPDTAFQFCSDEHPTNADYINNKFGGEADYINNKFGYGGALPPLDAPRYDLNVSNQVGDGIGTEAFVACQGPKTLQDKIELIYQKNVPYIIARDAPPSPIPLSDVINHHDSYTFQNKRLAGGPSGRSGIPAVIAPPSHSEEYWKTNDFLVRSGINSEMSTDLTRSGYLIQDVGNNNNLIEPYGAAEIVDNRHHTVSVHTNREGELSVRHGSMIDSPDDDVNQTNSMDGVDVKENFKDTSEPKGMLHLDYTSNLQQQPPSRIKVAKSQCASNNYDVPPTTACNKEIVTVGPVEHEMINMPYGYDANQLEASNLPSNLPSGDIPRDPVFNTYNKDIFTTTIQPGVYSRTEIVEPLNSNIGISFPQQFEPVQCEKADDGGVVFVQKDSRIIPVNQKIDITPPGPDESNVYDPRFTGYGTNYRAYIDTVTGQPRFYYDDVMVHRQNNYITRNKLDFTDFGARNNQINQKYSNADIRTKAQNAFADNTINFRTELQTRLLRKVNVNAWQQKVAPITRASC